MTNCARESNARIATRAHAHLNKPGRKGSSFGIPIIGAENVSKNRAVKILLSKTFLLFELSKNCRTVLNEFVNSRRQFLKTTSAVALLALHMAPLEGALTPPRYLRYDRFAGLVGTPFTVFSEDGSST